MPYEPIIVLVGKTNVGKSTLFNRLTNTRNALVADFPGLTRDRHYGKASVASHNFIVVDTGGFDLNSKDQFSIKISSQTRQALDESDIVIFLTDGRSGLSSQDYEIAKLLRKFSQKRILLAVNKVEGRGRDSISDDFYKLGFSEIYLISSSHGDGISFLIENALAKYPSNIDNNDFSKDIEKCIRLAIVGKPNVGKSTLINSLLGEDRLLAFDMPGTTKDSIDVDFVFKDKKYILVDTAGVRRKNRVVDYIEKFSVIKTIQSIESSDVVLLVINALDEISDQDAHLAGFILESGKSIVVAINKCDGMNKEQLRSIERSFRRKIHFLSFADIHMISGLTKYNIHNLFPSINEAYESSFLKLSTPKINNLLKIAIDKQPPPKKNIIRPKLRYAHQGGQNPPVIVIHGNALDAIPNSYIRYLESFFRKEFNLKGTPLRVEFKSSKNPYI